jgi:hypothetical protein
MFNKDREKECASDKEETGIIMMERTERQIFCVLDLKL